MLAFPWYLLFPLASVDGFGPSHYQHGSCGALICPRTIGTMLRTMSRNDSESKNTPELGRRYFLAQAGLAAMFLAAPAANGAIVFEKDPINKRSGIKMSDAEKAGYNVAFVTYLTRFLLSFDSATQKYWFASTKTTSPQALFAQLSASVEVGLQSYSGKNGQATLLKDLLRRYCPPTEESDSKRRRREIKEARRQLALLFSLLEDRQPVKEITQLLAQIDNGRVATLELTSTEITVEDVRDVDVVVQAPYVDGSKQAVVEAQWKPTGKVSCVEVLNGGSGYSSKPTVYIGNEKAKVKVKNGAVTEIQYNGAVSGNGAIRISAPTSTNGTVAEASLVLEQQLVGLTVVEAGDGYAAEKPLAVYLGQKDKLASLSFADLREKNLLRKVGNAKVTAERSSYSSFRKEDQDNEQVVSGSASGPDNGLPPLPFWAESSPSSDLLRLFPAGIGLAYNKSLQRYELAADATYQKVFSSSRSLGPEFGPRGRAPIEKDMDLTTDALLRFAASGAVCASGVHLLLTPLDVLKTKVQTNPSRYETISQSFSLVYDEEGPSTFFTGWIPTLFGNLLSGGILYVLTEVIRRSLSAYAGPLADTYEVPIILAAAATASAVGSVLICPFEAVRIRSVAQPNFASNAFGVLQRLLDEEGIGSLVNAIPVFLVKNVPYAMTKFTIFDLTTERLYAQYPSTQEDLKLSLLVSLIGGVLGGTAAAVVSNPADCVISEIKKSKSSGTSAIQTAKQMLDKADGSLTPFFKGLPLRMVYYSLIASLQFLVYDGVRFALGIGPDDLKLYLDVLGGALQDANSPFV